MVRAREPFVRSMDRVSGVLALHSNLHGGPGRPRQHVSDILRGALVLAVGALDGLVLEAVAETIEPAVAKSASSQTVVKWVKDKPDRLLGALSRPSPTDEVVLICREQLGAMTFQKAKAIEGVLADVAQCGAPWAHAAAQLSTPAQRWTEAGVSARLNEFVLRRHAIAHSGDTAPGRATSSPIRLDYVVEAERVIRAVGLSVCDRVDERIKYLRRLP